MAINLPEIGQVDWGGELNSALTQLDAQTVVGADREGDNIVFVKNNGERDDLGSFKGAPGEPGPRGNPGPPGPPGGVSEEVSGVVYVDDFLASNSGNDTLAIRESVQYAVSMGLGLVQFAPRTYHLSGVVDIPPVTGLTLQGHLGKTIISGREDQSGASIPMAFRLTGTPGDLHDAIRFTGFTFWGGMSNYYDLGDVRARHGSTALGAPELQFSAGRILSCISTYGDGIVRTDASGNVLPQIYGSVRNIWVDHCEFLGTEGLPVFFRGNTGVTSVTDSLFRRCLDPGFVFCESVIFSGNRSEYSQDNGVSLSRGCSHAVAVANSIYGAWYNGIWGSGFASAGGTGMATAPGPRDITISGNVIEWSGEHGVRLGDFAGRASISGNEIYRTRPTISSLTPGVGIVVTGQDSSAFPLSVTVSGNTVHDAARGGVLIRNTVSATISGNNLTEIGSQYAEDGVTPRGSGADGSQNFGIGSGSSGNMGSGENVLVVGNSVVNRPGSGGVVYWPVAFNSGSSSQKVYRSNLASGTSQPASDT